jgi:hypothetical protein
MTPAQQPSLTAAEQCRLQTGLTLAEAARRIGKSRRALYDWHRDAPERFAAALKDLRPGNQAQNQNQEGKIMSIELLPADKQHPHRWHVRPNRCNCHPETCCCDDWALHDPAGNKDQTFFDKSNAEAYAVFKND